MATTVIEAAQILNQSLTKLGYPYQIDISSNETATAGISAVGTYSPSQLNRLLDQMNLVLIYRNYGLMFDEAEDPTRVFWRDAIKNGGGIEDIYHEIIEADNGIFALDFADLDEDGVKEKAQALAIDAYAFKQDNIVKKFHTGINSFRIKMSRTDLELSMIFTAEGLTRYIDVQMANMQWSANYKLMLETISAIKKMVDDNKIVYKGGYNPNSTDGVTTIVEAIRTTFDGMHAPSTAYNFSGILNRSSDSDLFLVTTPQFINRIRVRGYANAYNLDEYRDRNRMIILPEGTDLGENPNGEKVHAILVDRRAIVIALRFWQMMPKVIENSDFVNYFLNVKFLKGYNEFFNAVAFTGEEVNDFFQSDDEFVILEIERAVAESGYARVYVNGIEINNYRSVIYSTEEETSDYVKAWQIPKGSLVEYTFESGSPTVVYDGYTIGVNNFPEGGSLIAESKVKVNTNNY